MSKNKIITGIELGSSKIVTLVAQISVNPNTFEKSISIVGVATSESRGIKKGQIVNIEEAVEATISSIESAERMAGYNIDNAYVAIGGASVSSINSHGVVAVSRPDDEISMEDIDRAIEAASAIQMPPSRELIHVIPREFSVDGESGVKDPVGMSGVRLEVDTHIVTASSATVRNLSKALNDVGVNINDMIFSGVAASEAVLSRTEKELGCALIDIGGGTTSVAVYSGGALSYSGVIPIGAANVTNDLAIGLRVSLESAEKIKLALSKLTPEQLKSKSKEEDELDLVKLGLKDIKKVSKKTLVEGIIRPRLNEIFTMVKLSLEKAGFANNIPSGVVITGGGANTIGIEDSAKRMLNLPVRIGKPKGLSGLVDEVISPTFAVPAGLIIYGASLDPVDQGSKSGGKIKMPSTDVFGKVVDRIKGLLP